MKRKAGGELLRRGAPLALRDRCYLKTACLNSISTEVEVAVSLVQDQRRRLQPPGDQPIR